MDKNLIRLLLVLVILTAVTGYFFWDNTYNRGFEGNDQNFAVPNPDLISRIIITDREGNQSDLIAFEKYWLVAGIPVDATTKALMLRFKPKASVYRGGYWIVNDQFLARPAAIGIVLETLKKIKVDQPLPEQAEENVLNEMIKESRKVEIFFGDDQPGKVFHIGGGAPNSYGTYTVMEQEGQMADQVYLTYILNFDGYLGERFISNPRDWRDRAVFRYLPEEIARIQVDYPDKTEHSFELITSGDAGIVRNPNHPEFGEAPVDASALAAYLQHFGNISIEAYLNDVVDRDTMNVGPVFAHVELEDHEGKVRGIDLMYKPVNQRTKLQFDETGSPVLYDKDRFYGEMNEGKDFVIAQYFVFGKVLKTYGFFAGQPAETLE